MGDDAQAIGETYLADDYGDWGPGMAAGMPKSAEAVLGAVEASKAKGTETLIFNPSNNDLGQVEALHKALGGKTEF